MTGAWMEAHTEQVLCPELRPGDVVVMDNLGAHRSVRVRALIDSHEASLIFLPPYSSDLNPIELAWSKVKTLLRSTAARTYDSLLEGVEHVLRAISDSDAVASIRTFGYQP